MYSICGRKPVSLSPTPQSEKWILEVRDCTCKDLSFHKMGPETILTHFLEAFQEEVRESATPALGRPCFLAPQTHREDCSSLPGNVSHPPICVIGIPKHRSVRCLLNPSGSTAFQTVGEHSVTAADLVLVTTGRLWREQWSTLRAQSPCARLLSTILDLEVSWFTTGTATHFSSMFISSLGLVDFKGKCPRAPTSWCQQCQCCRGPLCRFSQPSRPPRI